jgi:hypothetical protein
MVRFRVQFNSFTHGMHKRYDKEQITSAWSTVSLSPLPPTTRYHPTKENIGQISTDEI